MSIVDIIVVNGESVGIVGRPKSLTIIADLPIIKLVQPMALPKLPEFITKEVMQDVMQDVKHSTPNPNNKQERWKRR